MVVLAASICTRGGKALLSRQFRDVTKDRITGLLANFPSLISNSGSQHTTVEDEHVRYVYQPLEEFYIVLITNKHSNILQDIDTLHLFASTVSNMLRVIDDREIFENAFQILSAFDEIINLGFKENLTLSQVQTFLEMDSHEEKIQEIIERNKELEATEERKRRAKEIQRKELARRNLEQSTAPIINSSFGYDSYQNQFNSANQSTYQPTPSIEQSTSNTTLGSKPVSSRGGLQLGKKTGKVADQNQPLLSQNQPSFNRVAAPQSQSQIPNLPSPMSQSASPVPQAEKVPNNGILITVNERVTAELSREGSVTQSEVKGDLQLRINDSDLASSKILLKTGDKSSGVQYKTHPNVDRNLFTQQNIIGLKDKTKPFPSNDQSLGVLRWRVVGKNDDSSLLPIVITAWVTSNDGVADVTLEYELTSSYVESHQSQGSLENIKILVPLPSPDVNLKEESDNIAYDITDYGVVFSINSISLDDPQGSFEFSISSPDEDSLFPMELQFDLNKTDVTESEVCLGKVQVLDVVSNNEDEESLPFDLHSNLISEGYQVN